MPNVRRESETTLPRRTRLFGAFPAWPMIGVPAACVVALCLAAGSPVHAADPVSIGPEKCDGFPQQICTMTIKIFNDNPGFYIFPVLTTGKSIPDKWMQTWFKVPKSRIDIDLYPRFKNYRLYLNIDTAAVDAGTSTTGGLAPGQGVVLTLPLYTRLVTTDIVPNPPQDQLINWWNGGIIQIYSSPTADMPQSLREALQKRPVTPPPPSVYYPVDQQAKVNPPFPAAAILPTCTLVNSVGPLGQSRPTPPACATLQIFSDVADLPKADFHQLLEHTLGALNAIEVKNATTDPPNTLDVRNVDFDVSYVNLAFLPAVMGPFANDQVGYVGSPLQITTFKSKLNQFLTDTAVPAGSTNPGERWPQFVHRYRDGTTQTMLKIPSPLEIFARITPGAGAQTDLTPPPTWPTDLWKPIENLRTNWKTYAGTVTPKDTTPFYTVTTAGQCTSSGTNTTFCDAILQARELILANYTNYRNLYTQQCQPTNVPAPVAIDNDRVVAHVYGWTPWTENCKADDEKLLLQNTPGGYADNKHKIYRDVKTLFDKLNYGQLITDGPLTDQKYEFNPYVRLIHGANYLNAPNTYAYSVDDAMGNIQAEGLGFIVDIGDVANLENKNPAKQPIVISVGFNPNAKGGINFTSYSVCKRYTDAKQRKQLNPNFLTFVINAVNPPSCPVYLYDNKSAPQEYAFVIKGQVGDKVVNGKVGDFAFFESDSDPLRKPSKQTMSIIGCAPPDINGNPPREPNNLYDPKNTPSSLTWCCQIPSYNGVFASAFREPDNPHRVYQFQVGGLTARTCVNDLINGGINCDTGLPDTKQACTDGGTPIGTSIGTSIK